MPGPQGAVAHAGAPHPGAGAPMGVTGPMGSVGPMGVGGPSGMVGQAGAVVPHRPML
ncbi:hypothetical protein O1L60_01985 [Streptomyces diastatochromogenes]|nr:hypothetical protein [Streptomyces diastatochromogenes]